MANTFVLIASHEITTSTMRVTFSSIPSTYTDLVLRVSARGTNASIINNPYIQVNGNTTAMYYWNEVYGDGAGMYASRTNADTDFRPGYLTGANATTNAFASGEWYFCNYTSALPKNVLCYTAADQNATTSYHSVRSAMMNTTAAISSIMVDSGNFAAYSNLYLYGIKNS